MDVLELAMPKQQQKSRFLLMTCLSMRFLSLVNLWSGPISETGTDPGHRLVDEFCSGWLLHRPRPEWVVVDSQSSLRFGEFREFLEHAGIRLTVIPGEAHWVHGKAEAMVQVAKRTMRRLRNELPRIVSPRPCSSCGTCSKSRNESEDSHRFNGLTGVIQIVGQILMIQPLRIGLTCLAQPLSMSLARCGRRPK